MENTKINQFISISSREKLAREKLKKIACGFNVNTICDRLGSCMIHIPSHKVNAKKVMISFPLDEFGYMITKIDDDGCLRITSVSNQNTGCMIARKVLIQTRDYQVIEGYSEIKYLDLRNTEINLSASKEEDILIHCGFISKAEAIEAGIHIGDPVVIDGSFNKLNNLVVGRGLDVRIGLDLTEQLLSQFTQITHDYDLYIGGVAQEKVNFRGAVPLTTTILPDINISLALDVETKEYGINSGVFIRAFDKTTIPNIKLLTLIEKFDVHTVVGNEGTSASFIHKSINGVPSVVMGIHAKNIGSSSTICNNHDINQLELVLQDLLNAINEDVICELIEGV